MGLQILYIIIKTMRGLSILLNQVGLYLIRNLDM
nr:MAG TPA: hypothetical protein [Caudoviricetes sp.]